MSYIKKKSKTQEEKTAKEFGGRTQSASGAVWSNKGDVKTPLFLIENKFTDKDYYIFSLATWKKIWKEATKEDLRTPLMQIDIQDLSIVVGEFYSLEEFLGEVELHFTTACSCHSNSFRIKKDYFKETTSFVLSFDGLKTPLLVVLKKLFIDSGIIN